MVISDLDHLEVTREKEKVKGGLSAEAGSFVIAFASGNVGAFSLTKAIALTGAGYIGL